MISGCFAAESIIENLEMAHHFQLTAKDRLMHESAFEEFLEVEMGYAFMRGNLLTEIIQGILGPIGAKGIFEGVHIFGWL